MTLRYIITGTGHGGTEYAAHFATAAGVPCAHEWIFGLGSYNPNGVDGPHPGSESSSLVGPWWGSHMLTSRASGIHITRDPMRSVRSLVYRPMTGLGQFRRFVSGALGEYSEQSRLGQAVEFYVRWHRLIEKSRPEKYVRVQVEDREALLAALGVDVDTEAGARAADRAMLVGRNANSKTPREVGEVTRDDLRSEVSMKWEGRFLILAEEYGYEI